ncbi:MAG: twin-arginine translocase TatA/TatE family subunit [Leucobacter sp.]
MLGNLNGPTLIVILFIVLLLFGAPKLPGLAKSLGQSMKILKKEVSNDDAKGAKDGKGAEQNTADSSGASGSADASGSTGTAENSSASDTNADAAPHDHNKGGSSSS